MEDRKELKGIVKDLGNLENCILNAYDNASAISIALENKAQKKYQAYVLYLTKKKIKRIADYFEFNGYELFSYKHTNIRAREIRYAISRTSANLTRLKNALLMVRNRNTAEMILDEDFYRILRYYEKKIDTDDYMQLDYYI